jgi:hypothetical protein
MFYVFVHTPLRKRYGYLVMLDATCVICAVVNTIVAVSIVIRWRTL